MHSTLRRLGAIMLAVVAGLGLSSAAFADNLQANDLTASGTYTVQAGASDNVGYRITANSGDGQSGCNAADASPAVVTIHAPAAVTVTPSSLTFTNCGTSQSVQFSASVAGDYAVSATVNDGGAGTYNTNPAGFTLHVTAPPPPADTTPPVVTVTPDRAPDSGTWYNHQVTFTATANEPATCDAPVTYSGPDNAAATVTMTCTDTAGNPGTGTASFAYDATAPTLNPSVSPNPVVLNDVATATPGASDNLSGLAGASCGTVNTATVGAHSVACTATDNAGNTATGSASYAVVYRWDGFLQPINDTAHQTGLDTSVFKAGSTVPVKFQLKDANGNVVQAAAAPLWITPVKGSATSAAVDESLYGDTAFTGSTFRWDATAQQYVFNWGTSKAQAGFYWRIGVKLDDGSTYYVNIGLR